MKTDTDLLLRSAARLYSLGIEVESARERLRKLAEMRVSYESPEMLSALRDFSELESRWKELERQYIDLRGEILKERGIK